MAGKSSPLFKMMRSPNICKVCVEFSIKMRLAKWGIQFRRRGNWFCKERNWFSGGGETGLSGRETGFAGRETGLAGKLNLQGGKFVSRLTPLKLLSFYLW